MGTTASKSKRGKYGKDSESTTEVASSAFPEQQISKTQLPIHEGSLLSVSHVGYDKLAVCSDDKRISIIDTNLLISGDSSYTPKYLRGHSKSVNMCKVAPKRCTDDSNGQNHCWSVSRDLSLKQWDIDSQHCLNTISDAHGLNITGLALPCIGSDRVFSGSRDYSVKGWDTETGAMAAEYAAPRNIVTTLQCGPTNPHLLYQGAEDLYVRIWDTRSPSHSVPVQHISGFVYFPVSMDISDDGNYLATGCKGFDSVGCTVKLWDLRKTSTVVSELSGAHSQDVVGCQFINGTNKSSELSVNQILSASKDGSLSIWDASTAATSPKLLQSTNQLITGISCNDRGQLAVSANNGSLLLMSYANDQTESSIVLECSTAQYFSDEAGSEV